MQNNLSLDTTCESFCILVVMLHKEISLKLTSFILFMGCFTIRVHLQKLHSSPVLTVEAYFDFKVLWSMG